MEDMKEFQYLLARNRRRLGWSQSKLAERVEVDHSYISRLEGSSRHPRRPSRDMAEKLAEVFDLTYAEWDAFMLSAGFAPKYMVVQFLPRELQDLVQVWEEMPDIREELTALVVGVVELARRAKA